MKLIRLYLFFFILCIKLFGITKNENSILGYIYDKDSSQPIGNVNIYINNTSFGTKSSYQDILGNDNKFDIFRDKKIAKNSY